MMRDTKRSFALFSFYDRTGIETYLEKQAENGWLLVKTSALGWKFKRIEPRKIHFAVTYFPNASSFDPFPSEKQLRFQEFCEHTGWKLAASSAQMQIFYNELEEPIPIETEPEIEIRNIHASAKKLYLPNYFMEFFVGAMQMVLWFFRLHTDPIGMMAVNANFFTAICWILVMLLAGTEIIGYFRWYKKAKKAAYEDGSFVETKGNTNFQIVTVCFMFLALACMLISYGSTRITAVALSAILIIMVITAIIVGISEMMKRMKVTAKVNRNVTILLTLLLSFGFTGVLTIGIMNNITVFLPQKEPVDTYEFNNWTIEVYDDNIPLKIEDLMNMDYEGYSYEERSREQSMFLEKYRAFQTPRKDALDYPRLEYTIVTVKADFLYDWCKKVMLNEFAHNYGYSENDEFWKTFIEIDAKPWGAKEVYQLQIGEDDMEEYLLCYDEYLIEIDFDWEVTDSQKKVISKLFNLSNN